LFLCIETDAASGFGWCILGLWERVSGGAIRAM
jgi:hypothetical protein